MHAGGPAMIRAAAKNHSHVAVVVDPNDYKELLHHLSGNTASQEAVQYRKRLAWKAFQHCATYDSTVAEWLWSQIGTITRRSVQCTTVVGNVQLQVAVVTDWYGCSNCGLHNCRLCNGHRQVHMHCVYCQILGAAGLETSWAV